MDYVFIKEHLDLFIKAGQLTLYLAFWGILFSTILGFMLSLILFFKIKLAKTIVNAYIEFSRNTPLLIQLFFLYYGLPKVGIMLDAEVCAVIGLTFLGSSYMAEAFRGGLESVSKAQTESGLSIGLTKIQLLKYLLLPQAFTVSLPAIGGNIIFLLKETSMFSAIALADLMFVAKDLIGMYYKTTESLFMVVVAYFIILIPISVLLSYIERRLKYVT